MARPPEVAAKREVKQIPVARRLLNHYLEFRPKEAKRFKEQGFFYQFILEEANRYASQMSDLLGYGLEFY